MQGVESLVAPHRPHLLCWNPFTILSLLKSGEEAYL
jgi:hypothetical protein